MFLAVVSFFSLLCRLLIHETVTALPTVLDNCSSKEMCDFTKIPMMGQVPSWAQTRGIGKQAIGMRVIFQGYKFVQLEELYHCMRKAMSPGLCCCR